MKKDGLISIGEMSEICKVSKRTLRYYDVIGLVSPAYINDDNGYRYYEPYQVGRIHLVRQMQELGISLDDVASCVREKGTTINLDEFFENIKKREAAIEEELKLLKNQQKRVKGYLTQYETIHDKLDIMDQDIHITYYPNRFLISKCFNGKLNRSMFGPTFAEIGSCLEDKFPSTYTILPQIGSCYSGQRNSDSCINHIGFFMDTPCDTTLFTTKKIDAGFFATYRFQGEYRDIDSQYEMMFEYLKEMHYERKDCCVEIYKLSPSIHLNEKKYITELQIAIQIDP